MKWSAGMALCALLVVWTAVAGDVVVRTGSNDCLFVEVDGTSWLPLEYMRTGTNVNEREKVTLPRYWIAREMVTEGDFAMVMGRKVREGRDPDKPVTSIEWIEALEFCERFTKQYHSQLPRNCIASMPLAIEWAHAVRVLKNHVDLCGEAGTFLFTMNQFCGFLHTYWKGAEQLTDAAHANENLAWKYAMTPKRRKLENVGLRLVLVDVTKGYPKDHPIEVRGEVALRLGYVSEGQRYLELAMGKGMLSSNDLACARNCLEFAKREREYDFEDWSGIVAVPARFAAKRGYQIDPFASGWMMRGWKEMEDEEVAAEYKKHGISGRFMRIGDLPDELRKDQHENDTHSISIDIDGELQDVGLPIGSNTLVQVIECDFTGDGRRDSIVEEYGSVGSDGFQYNFYQQLPNGAYTNVMKLQTVGLCVLPKKDGGACCFLCVDKVANPVLAVRLLSWEGGEALFYEAHERPFYILDVDESHIYGPAPFVGAGCGLGWKHFEGIGKWFRPPYWPWKQGAVQGYDAAVSQAKKQAAELGEARKRVVALRKMYPRAADRISMWDMPDYAKRFFEIDRYQHEVWKHDDPLTTAVFEKMCREAIDMKIEPPVWYYNLACALSLQGHPDEAFEALGQAIAAGYDDCDQMKEDCDFRNIAADPRFRDRLDEMKSLGTFRGRAEPLADAIATNGCLNLGADEVYFAFKEKCYWAHLGQGSNIGLFYMDRDGKNGAEVEGFLSVRYDEEGVRRGRDKGLASLHITYDSYDMPIIARGTFSAEEIRTDAFDAVKTAERNVLGLYSAAEYPEKLSWCLLYRGGEEEGIALAMLIRKAVNVIERDVFARMCIKGKFAFEMVRLVHMALRQGEDGNVIDVKDIDEEKLINLSRTFGKDEEL